MQIAAVATADAEPNGHIAVAAATCKNLLKQVVHPS